MSRFHGQHLEVPVQTSTQASGRNPGRDGCTSALSDSAPSILSWAAIHLADPADPGLDSHSPL